MIQEDACSWISIQDSRSGTILSQALKYKFHELTAKTLSWSQRGRPDLQLPTDFMYTWVMNPDGNYWKKLTHEWDEVSPVSETVTFNYVC